MCSYVANRGIIKLNDGLREKKIERNGYIYIEEVKKMGQDLVEKRKRKRESGMNEIIYLPYSISYRSMPNAQRSTDKLCPVPRIISGARYSGVPHIV